MSTWTSTWALQLAFVATLLTAAVCGREAERHRSTSAGIVAVFAGIVTALLLAVLLYRGAR